MADATEALLRAILSTIARQTFPESKLREIVMSRGAGTTQLDAYNRCDGTKTQGEIAKSLGLDQGNFSRTVGRWVDAGICFRIGADKDFKLQHLYPLPPEHAGQKDKNK